MVGCYRLSSALDLIVNPRVGSVNPYPDEVSLDYGQKPFRSDQRWHGLGARGVRLWPAAGQTRESGVPDRQTGTLETSFVMTARRDNPGKNS